MREWDHEYWRGGEKSSNGGRDVLSGLALLRILYTFWERTWGYYPE